LLLGNIPLLLRGIVAIDFYPPTFWIIFYPN